MPQRVWAGKYLDLGPTLERSLDHGFPEYFGHDVNEDVLLGHAAVDLGRNEHGVWGGDKGVFGDRIADIAQRDFGGERFAVVYHRFFVAVVDIH